MNFGKVVSTRRACPGSTIEDEFLRRITDTGFSFGIQEENLMFSNGTTVLEFNRSNAGS
ncbi:hypothetical protein [Pricia sp.]|uniref:hypothetical protein n=1 Tax=Pricia sp. TaxID=2268138 RepID=UPI0035937795